MRRHNLFLLFSAICMLLGVLFLIVQFVRNTSGINAECHCNYKFINKTSSGANKCIELYEVNVELSGQDYTFNTNIMCDNCNCARGFNCGCETDLFSKCREINVVGNCQNNASDCYLIGSYISFTASGFFILISFGIFLRADNRPPTPTPPTANVLHTPPTANVPPTANTPPIHVLGINESTETRCTICFTEKRKIAFAPCGHFTTCETCSRKISSNCPVCREIILMRLSIYL